MGFPDVAHPWYADNACELGTLANVELYFNSLKLFIPGCGYYPGPSKSVFIVHPDNIKAGKCFGLCHRFKFFTGERYLGGFIGEDNSKRD